MNGITDVSRGLGFSLRRVPFPVYARPDAGVFTGAPSMFHIACIAVVAPAFWPFAGAAAGVYFFYRGFRLLQRKRLIMNTPSSKIRSAAMGLVEVSGLATGPYTVTAPITGLPCYYYRTLVWQWKQQGKSSGWERVAEDSLHVPFFLDDNTGRLLINPQGAELDIHRDFHDEFSTSVFSSELAIPANITSFLMMHGVSTDKAIKIDEYCVKPKNALFVLGTLMHNPGIEVTAMPVRSVGEGVRFNQLNQPLVPAPTHPVSPAEQARLADILTKAGIRNPAAWAAAGISHPASTATPAGGGTAAAAAPASEPFDLKPSSVLMKGTHDPTFLISWKSQHELLSTLSWKSALMIWGGPALTLLCVYILSGEFGWFK